jgi:hypothetical protein
VWAQFQVPTRYWTDCIASPTLGAAETDEDAKSTMAAVRRVRFGFMRRG